MKSRTKLYEIRETNDLSQMQMAKLLSVSRQNYSFWEIDALFIPLKHLNNFCNIFNVSMDYVFNLTDKNIKTNYITKLDKVEIGKKIKIIMKENNLTQTKLANILNTTQSTISSYINGQTLILTSFAYQIVTKFSVSLDWLCGKTENMKLK